MRRHALRIVVAAGVLYAHWAPPGTLRAFPDALGHAAMSAALAAAAWGLAPLAAGTRAATILAAGLLAAILLEASQPRFGRAYQPADVLADLAGLAAAVVALAAWHAARPGRQ